MEAKRDLGKSVAAKRDQQKSAASKGDRGKLVAAILIDTYFISLKYFLVFLLTENDAGDESWWRPREIAR